MADDLFDWADSKKPEKCPFPVPLDVCTLFERLTMQLWRAGRTHYSARAILHRIRWHFDIDVGDRGFKANNNWTPALARWVMRLHPEIGEFFSTRSSPREPGHDPRHDTEDYMGPYE